MSSTAMITPLSDGSAVFELNGITHQFDDWRTAVAEAETRGLRWRLDRSPNPQQTPRPGPVLA